MKNTDMRAPPVWQKLMAYECRGGGFEWFGSPPGHETLTSYGLLQFHEMASVYSGVEKRMLERTTQWVLDQRDGNGGFKKNPKALDSFGRSPYEVRRQSLKQFLG